MFTASTTAEHVSAPADTEQSADDEGDGHRLTDRGYRWINEVPFNR